MEKFKIIMAVIVGIVVFIGFMSMVGNPHHTETSIGVALAVGSALGIYKLLGGKEL